LHLLEHGDCLGPEASFCKLVTQPLQDPQRLIVLANADQCIGQLLAQVDAPFLFLELLAKQAHRALIASLGNQLID
jgi:hypothetical protein